MSRNRLEELIQLKTIAENVFRRFQREYDIERARVDIEETKEPVKCKEWYLDLTDDRFYADKRNIHGGPAFITHVIEPLTYKQVQQAFWDTGRTIAIGIGGALEILKDLNMLAKEEG